jgi:hypothetical protein
VAIAQRHITDVSGPYSNLRDRPLAPNTVIRVRPDRKYCHSSALGCQCISRRPPRSIRMVAPVMLVEIGNSFTDAMRIVPPGNFWGCCASSR